MSDTSTPIETTREEYFGHERLVFDAGDGQIVKLIWVLPGVWSFAHLRAVRQTGEQPGFIPVLVADTATDGRPFLVHQRVDAGGYWEWQDTIRPIDSHIQVLWQAAKALTEAHLRGVFHGAFYPGAIVIIDGDGGSDDVALAEVGYGMGGTPPGELMEWVAPEFVTAYGMSAAADVWSLGRMLDRIPDLPPTIRAIADQALLVGPSARPSAAEIADVIQAHYGPDFEGDYGLAFLTGVGAADLGDLAIRVLEEQDQPPDPDPDPDPEPNPDPPLPATVSDVLTNTPDASMLLELLTLSADNGPVDWSSLIRDEDAEFTLFVPVNTAITALGQTVLDALIADPAGQLTDVLREHAIQGEALTVDEMVGRGEVTTMAGTTRQIRVVDGQVMIGGNTPMVITADLAAENGIVHLIDEVILPVPPPPPDPDPDPTIWDLVKNDPDFGTLRGALAAASDAGDTDFVDVLDSRDDGVELTLFAPTNAAFLALGADLDRAVDDPGGRLSRILDNHVVAGRVSAVDLSGVRVIETIAGGNLKVRSEDGELFVNRAHVEDADLEAVNGLVHVIDRVLVPPSMFPPNPDPDPDPDPRPPIDDDEFPWPVLGALIGLAAALLLALLMWAWLSDDDPEPPPPPPTTSSSTTIPVTVGPPITIDPPTTATIPAEESLSVEILSGLEGQTVDIQVGDEPLIPGLTEYQIAGPIELRAGTYEVQVTDENGNLLASEEVDVDSKVSSIIVYTDSVGDVRVIGFDDPLDETAAGHGLVVVRNLRPEPVEVTVGEQDHSGERGEIIPPTEEWSVEYPAAELFDVAIGDDVESVEMLEGERIIFTVVAGDVLVQRQDGEASPPGAIPAGNSGLRASTRTKGRSNPPLAVVGLLAVSLAALGGAIGGKVQEGFRGRRG